MFAKRVDAAIEFLKWPVAILATLSLPFLFCGLLGVLVGAKDSIVNTASVLIGAVGFALVWWRFLRKSKWMDWFLRLEHEATHALFALLTGHPVIGFRNSIRTGSSVEIKGTGNWLIAIAPYFFPTAAICLWAISLLLPIRIVPWTGLVLGFALGFHIVSTYRETHRDQSDLKQLSWRFVWMFLPAANLLVVGVMMAFALNGFTGIYLFFKHAIFVFGAFA